MSCLWPLALMILYRDRLKSLLSSHFCWLWYRLWGDKQLNQVCEVSHSNACFSVFSQTCNLQESYWTGLTRHVSHESVLTDVACVILFISKIPYKSLECFGFFLALLSTWQLSQPSHWCFLKVVTTFALFLVLWSFLCIPRHTDDEC